MKKNFVLALAGNPNSGKTTVFNLLTGAHQHVGNYPGVTVEKKTGNCRFDGREIEVVDLPGTYSLTAYSQEERIARAFITEDKPDVLVDVIDASNLERNLYLAVQLMELGVPVVLAFNMSDVAKARGMEFDMKMLQDYLGVPIIPMVGNRGEGRGELLRAAVQAVEDGKAAPPPPIRYAPEVEEAQKRIAARLKELALQEADAQLNWRAIKLLENDAAVWAQVKDDSLRALVDEERRRIENVLGETPEMLVADGRYGFISGVCQEAVQNTAEARHNASDRIDSVLIHRFWGLPIFMALMYLLFWVTFTLGTPPMEWIETFFGWLGELVAAAMPETMLRSLLVDGVIGGVGGVLVFLPNILLLFLGISILEDSGYMARAAFIMDRLMHKIGLHGKSFIPMLTGFGCSVPAIMATRTLENRRDRLTTMMVVPLMSCGARLPIYALIIPAFFPQVWQAPMLWIIYMTGILLAILCAKLLRSTLFKGESVPFVMELPPYRLPTIKGTLIHMWDRGGAYLKKAGTIILGISILLWAGTTFPQLPEDRAEAFETQREELSAQLDAAAPAATEESAEEDPLAEIDHAEAQAALSYSLVGRIGHALEPVIAPMGFDWRIGTAMIGAFAAKEVFVAQMGIVYSLGEEEDKESEGLREKLAENYSPLVGLCIMLFMLISAPCMATIAVTRREANSWGWALFQLAGLTVLAYIITVLVYQIGSLMGWGI